MIKYDFPDPGLPTIKETNYSSNMLANFNWFLFLEGGYCGGFTWGYILI